MFNSRLVLLHVSLEWLKLMPAWPWRLIDQQDMLMFIKAHDLSLIYISIIILFNCVVLQAFWLYSRSSRSQSSGSSLSLAAPSIYRRPAGLWPTPMETFRPQVVSLEAWIQFGRHTNQIYHNIQIKWINMHAVKEATIPRNWVRFSLWSLPSLWSNFSSVTCSPNFS